MTTERKRGSLALTEQNVANKGENVFTEGKRAPERRKRFLPRENEASKGEKEFTKGKRVYRAKTRSPCENVARKASNVFIERQLTSERRKSLYRAKTSLAKAKTILLSESNFCKGENVFTERKHDNRAKTPLPSEEVKNAFNERKCGSQS